jgi:hypothetical protein
MIVRDTIVDANIKTMEPVMDNTIDTKELYHRVCNEMEKICERLNRNSDDFKKSKKIITGFFVRQTTK